MRKALSSGLTDKPVVVLSNNDGCIVVRSRKPKVLGIAMGTPEFKARNTLLGIYVRSTAPYGEQRTGRNWPWLDAEINLSQIIPVEQRLLR